MKTFTFRALLLAAAVLGPLRVAAESKTVHVEVPGTLPELLTTEEKENLTSLTVSGSLNGTDIGLIAKMAGASMASSAGTSVVGDLTELNLQDARIVAGGDYYAGILGRQYYTQDDVFPTFSFVESKLMSVVLPSSIKAVGQSVFAYNENLSSVTFTCELDSIGAHAFQDCPQLLEITLPTVHYLGDQAFMNCGFIDFPIQDGLDSLGNHVFRECQNLRELHLPASVVKMGESAFYRCVSLRAVTLPPGLEEIPASTFSGCPQLETMTLPTNYKRIGDYAFADCPIYPELPDGLEIIGASAFSQYNRTSIDLPSSLRIIGDNAFMRSNLTSVVIPEGVDSVGVGAFAVSSELHRVDVPSTLRKISANTFVNCYNLTVVNLDEGVEEIGDNAFESTGVNDSLTLPSSLRKIGSQAFAQCYRMDTIALPEGLTTIGDYAFSECGSLTAAMLPSTLTEVGQSAFQGCTALKTIRIAAATPPTATVSTFVGPDFERCVVYVPVGSVDAYRNAPGWLNFTYIVDGVTVTLPESKTVHVDVPGNLGGLLTMFEKENLTSLTVSGSLNGTDFDVLTCMARTFGGHHGPDGVAGKLTELNLKDARIVEGGDYYISSVGTQYYTQDDVFPSNAFFSSTITSVVLPSSIKFVGKSAFYMCDSLRSVTFTCDVDSICGYAFSGCPNLSELTLQKVGYIGENAFSDTDIFSLILQEGLDSIGDNAFHGCDKLRAFHMPNSVVKMGKQMFMYCGSLSEVTLSSGLTELPDETFRGCGQLHDLTLPSGIKRIGANAFYSCPATPQLPEGLVEIGAGAFSDYGAPTIELPSSLRIIGNGAFSYTDLTSIVIPEGVDSVGYSTSMGGGGAFQRCKYLRSAVIPSTLKRISPYMFDGCERLTNVTIAEGIEEIGDGAFKGCVALETLDLPASLRGVGYQALAECSTLSTIVLPEGLTTIGEEAFRDDEALATATLPSTLTEVGRGAFMGCSGLTSLYVAAATPPTAYVNSFLDVDVEKCTLYVPEGAVDVYSAAPYWQDFLRITDERPVGIGNVTVGPEPNVVGRYGIDGRPVAEGERGVQILRMSDGTWRKVMVK